MQVFAKIFEAFVSLFDIIIWISSCAKTMILYIDMIIFLHIKMGIVYNFSICVLIVAFFGGSHLYKTASCVFN